MGLFLILLLQLNVPGQGLQGNGTEGLQGNVSVQSHIGNQPSVQSTPNMSFQSLPQVVQIPLAAAAVPVPSLNSVMMYFISCSTINIQA